MSTTRERTLLLVDDEESVLSALKRLFRRDGYRVITASGGDDALRLLAANEVDVIISDQRMPGMTGVDFLRQAKQMRPGTIRMTLSGYTDLQSIIDAVNEGAVFKFLTKPWDDDRLRDHVAKAFRHKEMADENRRLSADLKTANLELEDLNGRLEHLLARQREQAELVQTSAGGLRDVVELLPAGLIGIDPDGTLVFLNRMACTLVPDAIGCLGGKPSGELGILLKCLGNPSKNAERVATKLILGSGPAMVWHQTLSPGLSRQGQVLMLVPWPEEVPA